MRKAIKAHQEKKADVKQNKKNEVPVPAYLMDREE